MISYWLAENLYRIGQLHNITNFAKPQSKRTHFRTHSVSFTEGSNLYTVPLVTGLLRLWGELSAMQIRKDTESQPTDRFLHLQKSACSKAY